MARVRQRFVEQGLDAALIRKKQDKPTRDHLPDKLRQQVTQYYREQFMPKCADLLKQYYSSLANTPTRMPELMK